RDFHVTGVQTCALPILSVENTLNTSFINTPLKKTKAKWFLNIPILTIFFPLWVYTSEPHLTATSSGVLFRISLIFRISSVHFSNWLIALFRKITICFYIFDLQSMSCCMSYQKQ